MNPGKKSRLQNSQEKMMTLSGANIQNFFATATLISAVVLCWSAEAAPKNPGNKQIARNASSAVTTQIGKSTDTVTCYVYNNSDENICVVYDVYPVWYFSQAKRGTVAQYLPGKTGANIAWAFAAQQASMQCKLVSASFMPWQGLCSISSTMGR
jgi:hypothetical protein